MKSLSLRMSVAVLAVLVFVGFAACMNPVAGISGDPDNGSLTVSSSGAANSQTVMPAANAEGGTPRIVWDMTITYDFSPGISDPHWIGTLHGPVLDGAKVEFWEKPANFVVGKTEHFFETMLITIGDDTIGGDDSGVWNFSTYKFRANGWVTDATGPWAYLVGYKAHETGFTTAFPPTDGSYVVHGTGTFWLAP